METAGSQGIGIDLTWSPSIITSSLTFFQFIAGEAQIVGPKRIQVKTSSGSEEITFNQIVIATGSRPAVLTLPLGWLRLTNGSAVALFFFYLSFNFISKQNRQHELEANLYTIEKLHVFERD